MRLTFRQGIVKHQTDTSNNPVFLQQNGNYYNLSVSPDPTIITFADGNKNYLFTESVTVNEAWGPFSTGTDYWLYWDINRITGIRTFGHTTLAPVQSATAPSSPATGQMWWNTVTNVWNEWTGSRWKQVLRVFAAKLSNGSVLSSMSANAPLYAGTQVGLNVSARAGSIAYDASGNPIKTTDNKFFTTEDLFVTGIPNGGALRVESVILDATAQENMSSYSVVQLSDFNEVNLASPFDEHRVVFGIIEQDVTTSEITNVTTEGIIHNPDWNWSGSGLSVNDPVYIDQTGQIVTSAVIPNQLPVGAVLSNTSILFKPGIFTIGGSGGSSNHGDLTGLSDDDHPQYLNETRGDARYYTQTQIDNRVISDLSNVTITSPTNNQFLRFDGTQWINETVSTSASLVDLSDTNISTPSDDQFLRYDGTQWVNETVSLGETDHGNLTGLGDDDHPQYLNQTRGDARYYTQTQIDNRVIGDLSNVNISSPSDDQFLRYDGTQWVNETVSLSGSSTLADLNDTQIGTLSNKDVLKYDSYNGVWINQPSHLEDLPTVYDVAGTIFGNPNADQKAMLFISPQDFYINDYGHQAFAGTNPTSDFATDTTFIVETGTPSAGFTQIGSISFNSAGDAQTNFTTPTKVVHGDIVRVTGPSSPDSTFADVAVSLRGHRITYSEDSVNMEVSGGAFTGNSGNFQTDSLVTTTGDIAYFEFAFVEFSTDSGSTWQKADGSVNAGTISFTPSEGPTILGTGSNQIYTWNRTTDVSFSISPGGVTSNGDLFRIRVTGYGRGNQGANNVAAGISSDIVEITTTV